jgi:hypothetical protein
VLILGQDGRRERPRSIYTAQGVLHTDRKRYARRVQQNRYKGIGHSSEPGILDHIFHPLCSSFYEPCTLKTSAVCC